MNVELLLQSLTKEEHAQLVNLLTSESGIHRTTVAEFIHINSRMSYKLRIALVNWFYDQMPIDSITDTELSKIRNIGKGTIQEFHDLMDKTSDLRNINPELNDRDLSGFVSSLSGIMEFVDIGYRKAILISKLIPKYQLIDGGNFFYKKQDLIDHMKKKVD